MRILTYICFIFLSPLLSAQDSRTLIEELDLDAFDKESRKVIPAFLACETEVDLLRHVRDPDRVKPIIRSFYKDRPFKSLKLEEIQLSSIFVSGSFRSFMLVLGDFTERNIVLGKTKEGLKIDWESWVGYSEMKWDELLKEKPVRPVLFRAVMQPASYYNYEYTDDKVWFCFRLSSPDDETVIYGYTKRGSKVDLKYGSAPSFIAFDEEHEPGTKANPGATKKPLKENQVGPVIISLKFQAGSKSRNLVLIEKVVQNGWALNSKEKEKDGVEDE